MPVVWHHQTLSCFFREPSTLIPRSLSWMLTVNSKPITLFLESVYLEVIFPHVHYFALVSVNLQTRKNTLLISDGFWHSLAFQVFFFFLIWGIMHTLFKVVQIRHLYFNFNNIQLTCFSTDIFFRKQINSFILGLIHILLILI